MKKIIRLDERFETGEPTVQPVVLWGLRGKPYYETLSKEASSSPALEYIKHIGPTPGRTVVLILGLGSYEFYGLNRNGDGFNENPYKPGQSNGPGRDAWIMENECIQHHFHSYEQGHVYRHHVNNDPKRAIGKVLKAFWNPFMHRVEVLEDLDNEKAPDLAEQVADGEFPPKSMGCRIKFDVCTECGNMAPTRKHYCDHLKFEMTRLRSSGLKVGALNPAPRFFDSSWVLRPADRTGYMLKKVADVEERPYELWSAADLGDYVADRQAKSAAARKLAVIDKVVRGYPAVMVQNDLPEASLIEKYRDDALPSVVKNTPELGAGDLNPLAKHNLADTLASLARSGILLTTPEFLKLFLQKTLPSVDVPEEVFDRLAALQGELFDLLSNNPGLIDDTMGVFTSTDTTEADKDTEALREKRSTISQYLHRRFTPDVIRRPGESPPLSEVLDVQDPASGRTYQTTRGAARRAHDTIAETELTKMLGGGALLAATYKLLTAFPNLRPFKLPIGAGLGAVGYKTLAPNMGPTYRAHTGEEVPYLTEFVEKRSSFLDTVNTLGQDYAVTSVGPTRFTRAIKHAAHKPALHNVLRKLASFGVLTLPGITEHVAQFKHAADGIVDGPLDFDKVAAAIGNLVLDIPPD